ncbi:F-box domain-containing protein [Ophiocordyceps sinensis CO18]|uniref:F-box domain-containing protein n=1 Tax=Ophiocordyceps sinensis (strain Co18 / CGMCC 3.14243) TaxID=911162 RepID=T5AAD2_OPHSC|nr:F-box domain-containing protein [Ophiocordyceps sinensis CO18]
MSTACCVLCGATIGHELDGLEPWMRQFRAGNVGPVPARDCFISLCSALVFTRENDWDQVQLSGIGLRQMSENRAPTDADARYDQRGLSPDDTVDIDLVNFGLDVFTNPDPDPHIYSRPIWGYGFHAACWQLLVMAFKPSLRHLFHACLSTPLGFDGLLDWGHDYGGAAEYQVKPCDCILVSRVKTACSSYGLRSNPVDIPLLLRLFNTPDSVTRYGELDRESHLSFANIYSGRDPFRLLPLEILQFILTQLPSDSVCAARHSSRVLATTWLPESFWASRFAMDNEFPFVYETRRTKPSSWRCLYLGVKEAMSGCPNLKNRRRIWKLAGSLQKLLANMSLDECAGHPLFCYYDSATTQSSLPWLTAYRCLRGPQEYLTRGCRALRCRMANLRPSSCIIRVTVSFVELPDGTYVSGIRLEHDNGHDICLGYVDSPSSTVSSICLRHPTLGVRGFHLALEPTGVKGIAALMGDGALSNWVGEHDGIPKWCLADGRGGTVSSIKAEFDAFKLVSLGISTDALTHVELGQKAALRNTCLWSPDIPPEHLLSDGTGDDYPTSWYNGDSLPLSTVIFGGSTGQDLSHVAGVVVWIFDVDAITGMEFQYADGRQSQAFGHVGPYPDESPIFRREWVPSHDDRIPFPIDGPGGERIVSAEAQERNHHVIGLKASLCGGRWALSRMVLG